MAKIVQFNKPLNKKSGYALDAFIDDDDLLEFSRPEDVQPQTSESGSIHASDWTNQELADLYRAHSLVQSAQPELECDRGISDEGDPWFLIGDDKGDVLVHICRIKGMYILDSAALSKPLRGNNFKDLIQDFLITIVGSHAHGLEATNQPTNVVSLARGGTVCLHPSMMIAALVWTLLMNSDELTLPHSSGISQKDLGQGPNREQDGNHNKNQGNAWQEDSISSNDDWANMSDPASFEADKLAPMKSGAFEKDASDFYTDLSAGALSAQMEGSEEKQLNVAAYSSALTTLAIAIGFYASSEASKAFWKPTLKVPDPSIPLSEPEMEKTSDFRAPIDHLSDALALLNNVVDLIVLESDEHYATDNQDAGNESADPQFPSNAEYMEVNIGYQVFAVASKALKTLADASDNKAFDPSARVVEATIGSETENVLPKGASTDLFDLAPKEKPKKQVSDTSIENITQAYETTDASISRYNAFSLKAGLEEFGDDLEPYSDALEDSVVSQEKGDPLTSEAEMPFPEASESNRFDGNARNFINSKIANSDVDILVFANEIVFVDKAAFSGNSMSVSWQLEDGGLVSIIGLSSDMTEFLVA